MSNSSILGGERVARQSKGKDVDSLGPSDSSDSGSDVQGETVMPTDPDRADELGSMPVSGNSDSDAMGTGERGSATGRDGPENADIMPMHIERANVETDDLALEDRLDLSDVDVLGTENDGDIDGAEESDVEGLDDERRPRRESRR
jgi:hypothetical protein